MASLAMKTAAILPTLIRRLLQRTLCYTRFSLCSALKATAWTLLRSSSAILAQILIACVRSGCFAVGTALATQPSVLSRRDRHLTEHRWIEIPR